jgi:hypothetical protein
MPAARQLGGLQRSSSGSTMRGRRRRVDLYQSRSFPPDLCFWAADPISPYNRQRKLCPVSCLPADGAFVLLVIGPASVIALASSPSYGMEAAMEEAFILQANIVRFRDLLVICNDPTQRRTIERLLGDAIHRLKRLEGGRGRPKPVSAEMKHGKTHIPAGPDRQPSGS